MVKQITERIERINSQIDGLLKTQEAIAVQLDLLCTEKESLQRKREALRRVLPEIRPLRMAFAEEA